VAAQNGQGSAISGKPALTGEDRVIIVCCAIIGVVTVIAIIAMVVTPQTTNTVVPMMSVAIAAITTLAARHPPLALAASQGPLEIAEAATTPKP
jgi:hypothetical protein